MKVRVVYDDQGNIVAADLASDGQRVGEFDLPEEDGQALDESGSNVIATLTDDEKARALEARRLRVLNQLRVDSNSNTLQPKE